jgi:hypothetical protein
LRGGFLICAKNRGRQVVKKIHLGVASSGYCPCPLRAPDRESDSSIVARGKTPVWKRVKGRTG